MDAGDGGILRKHAKPGDVLLTSIEPNMLVTYLNACPRVALVSSMFSLGKISAFANLSMVDPPNRTIKCGVMLAPKSRNVRPILSHT